MTDHGLIEGTRYVVVFQVQNGNQQWITRQMTAEYLGWNTYKEEEEFSLRPLGGNVSIKPNQIVRVLKTEREMEIPRGVR